MNRRKFALATIASSVAVITGCESEPKPSPTATLLNNEEVQEAIKAIDDSIAQLEDEVDNFDNENWRDVVPEVKSASDSVRVDFEKLKQALGYRQ